MPLSCTLTGDHLVLVTSSGARDSIVVSSSSINPPTQSHAGFGCCRKPWKWALEHSSVSENICIWGVTSCVYKGSRFPVNSPETSTAMFRRHGGWHLDLQQWYISTEEGGHSSCGWMNEATVENQVNRPLCPECTNLQTSQWHLVFFNPGFE